ncbi:MAG: hypothetical protein QGI83_16835 [Candidatus Latescibacteria bacterium]|nr:hypothetical protein [Candidatus Latescibacterota bacterium]
MRDRRVSLPILMLAAFISLLFGGTKSHADDPALARLSFWLPPERVGAFEEAYEARLLPVLASHGLEPSPEEGRATVHSVFSRLFEVKALSDVRRIERALKRDSTWTAGLRDLGAAFGSSGDGGRIQSRLGIYTASSGPGRPLWASPTFRGAARSWICCAARSDWR